MSSFGALDASTSRVPETKKTTRGSRVMFLVQPPVGWTAEMLARFCKPPEDLSHAERHTAWRVAGSSLHPYLIETNPEPPMTVQRLLELAISALQDGLAPSIKYPLNKDTMCAFVKPRGETDWALAMTWDQWISDGDRYVFSFRPELESHHIFNMTNVATQAQTLVDRAGANTLRNTWLPIANSMCAPVILHELARTSCDIEWAQNMTRASIGVERQAAAAAAADGGEAVEPPPHPLNKRWREQVDKSLTEYEQASAKSAKPDA